MGGGGGGVIGLFCFDVAWHVRHIFVHCFSQLIGGIQHIIISLIPACNSLTFLQSSDLVTVCLKVYTLFDLTNI